MRGEYALKHPVRLERAFESSENFGIDCLTVLIRIALNLAMQVFRHPDFDFGHSCWLFDHLHPPNKMALQNTNTTCVQAPIWDLTPFWDTTTQRNHTCQFGPSRHRDA